MHRTYIDTFSAADTFVTVWINPGIHIHLTGPGTFTTINTGYFIHVHPYQAHLLKESVKCAKGTDIFAERPVNDHGCQNAKH